MAWRHREISVEITLMLKRMRKAGMQFRYCIVMEAHASGLPHYHLLLHEFGDQISHAKLTPLWVFGFSRWKLAEDNRHASVYAAKYLSKNSEARVRASLYYGKTISIVTQPPG